MLITLQKLICGFLNIFTFVPSMLPIMLVLCSNMNNIAMKILLHECSIRVFSLHIDLDKLDKSSQYSLI